MVAGYLRSNLNAASARSGAGLVVGACLLRPTSAMTCGRSIFLGGQIGGFSSSTAPRGPAKQPHSRSPNSPSAYPRQRKKSSSSSSSSSSMSSSNHKHTSTKTSAPSSRSDTPDAHGREILGDVNPPTTTLPAALETPQKPSSPDLAYYMSLGRAYWVFYKTGVKNIWNNYKESRPLRQQLDMSLLIRPAPITAREFITDSTRLTGLPSLRSALSGKLAAQRRQADLAKYVHATDRRGLQLLLRSVHDARKAIPFMLVLFLCGELTPFVVAMGLIKPPRVCVLPADAEKKRVARVQTKEQLRAAMERQGVREGLFNVAGYPADLGGLIARAQSADVLMSARVLGVSRKPWFPALERIGLVQLAKEEWCAARVYEHFAYLAADDALIIRGGGVERLSAAEVRVALDERGAVEVMEKPEREQREWLERWVRASRRTLSKELSADV